MIRSLRAQLTVWYVGVLAFILIALAVASYYAAQSILYRRLNSSLLVSLQETERSLATQLETAPISSRLAEAALQTMHYPNRTIWLLRLDGQAIATKKAITGPELRFPAGLTAPDDQPHYYALNESRLDADDSCRGVFQRRGSGPENTYLVVVAQSDESISDQLDVLQDLAFVIVPLALILAASGGWFLARRSLAPIALITQTVQQINAANLEGRVPIRNPNDEIGGLSREFNQLLDRLAAALHQQRQFMADASHELRTPLSVARTAAEVTLDKEGRDEAEYREALSIVKQQARRLTHLVDGMFALARADMGQPTLHATDFYLDEIVAEVGRAASILAAQKGQRMETETPGELLYHGDEALIRQMILALLDNAVKFTPRGGSVKVSLQNRDSSYAITVSDSGPGIPIADQPHIFDRFYRADRARAVGPDGLGGTGLGLAVARSIAELHRGQLTLQRSDHTGSSFLILLPRSS